jgi:hypothetical protein
MESQSLPMVEGAATTLSQEAAGDGDLTWASAEQSPVRRLSLGSGFA